MNGDDMSAYAQAAIAAGWEICPKYGKWWNPKADDGSRYVNKESCLRALCEDHDIIVPSVQRP